MIPIVAFNRLLEQKPIVFWGLLISFALPIACFRIVDVDIWWHMQLGRSFLDGGVPNFSTYYFTPINENFHDLRYTFLGDILFFLVHQAAGDVGLQAMRLLFLGLSLGLIAAIAPKPRGGGLLLLLILVTAGCYQLLLVRNALFSLPLTSLLFWLWHQVRYAGKDKLIWLFPALLALWSTLHGTYLLGFGLLSLIFFGDLLDNLKEPGRPLQLMRYTGVLALSFGAILFKNPLTQSTIDRIWQSSGGPPFLAVTALVGATVLVFVLKKGDQLVARFGNKLYFTSVVLLALVLVIAAIRHITPYVSGDLADPALGLLGNLKVALSNTYWNTRNPVLVSSEFGSPFDRPGLLFVWTSLLLALTTVIGMIGRRLQLAYLLPFVGVLLLALGYQRIAGYLTLVSAFTLIRLAKDAPLFPQQLRQTAPVGCGFAVVALYVGLFTPLPTGLFDSHTLGPGRMVTFSTPMAERLRNEEAPIFTTIPVGGFLLYHWFPHKRVYVDGFFAPHFGPAFNDYKQALIQRDPDRLFTNHGTDMAVMGLTDAAWIDLFAKSEHWYPRYMDTGMLVFQRQPDFQAATPKLELFLDLQSIMALPKRYRATAANRLFELGTAYLLKGRLQEASTYTTQHADLLNNIRELATGNSAGDMERNLKLTADRFNGQNTKIVFHEVHYTQAMTQGDQKRLFYHGDQLLMLDPSSMSTALELADAALRWNQTGKAERYLRMIHNQRTVMPEFLAANKQQIADTWFQLAQRFVTDQAVGKAVQAMAHTTEYHAERYPLETVIQQWITQYSALKKAGKNQQSLNLLNHLDHTYPDQGPVLQYLAMHHVSNPAGDSLDTALAFARRARPLQEAAQAPDLDILYLIFKEIHKKKGDLSQARDFLEKARDVAPEARKQLYQKL